MEEKSHFIGRIESLRGLAALSVAIFHCFRWFSVGGHDAVFTMRFKDIDGLHVGFARVLVVLFNGNAAVSLCYVISGLVLGLSIKRSHASIMQLMVGFSIRRVFRLYPPMALNLVLVFIAVFVAARLAPTIIEAPSFRALAENLLYIEPALVSATWSLFIEMGIIPPFLIAMLVVRRFGDIALIGMLALGVISLFTDYGIPSFWTTWRLGNFFIMFILGAALPAIVERTHFRLSSFNTFLTLVLSFLTLGAARGIFGWDSPWALLLEAMASAILVAVTIWGKPIFALTALEHWSARLLGRLSYSFYLYHPLFAAVVTPPFLLIAAKFGLMANWPLACGVLLSALTVPPALLAAHWSYWRVEMPSLNMGNAISAKLSRGSVRIAS